MSEEFRGLTPRANRHLQCLLDQRGARLWGNARDERHVQDGHMSSSVDAGRGVIASEGFHQHGLSCPGWRNHPLDPSGETILCVINALTQPFVVLLEHRVM